MSSLGISGWVWMVVGVAAVAGLLVLAWVVVEAFRVVRGLIRSVDDTRRRLEATMAASRDDLERLQGGLERLGQRFSPPGHDRG